MAERDANERQSYGPAMLECTEQERQFVIEYVRFGKSLADAARSSGYGNDDGSSTANTYARIAYRISHRPRVIDAILEESRKSVRVVVPQAVKAVHEIISSQYHKDRARVALAMIERIDPTIQKQELTVTHKIDHEAEALDQLRALRALNVAREKLIELYGAFGLERMEKKLAIEDKSNVIDAEFSEAHDPDAALLGE